MKEGLDIEIPFRDLHFVMNDIRLCRTTFGKMDDYRTHTSGHALLLITGGNGTLRGSDGSDSSDSSDSPIRLQKGKCIHLPPQTKVAIAQENDGPLLYYLLAFSVSHIVTNNTISTNSTASIRPFNLNKWLPSGEMKGMPFGLLEEKMKELFSYTDEQDARMQIQRHFRFQDLIYFVLEQRMNNTDQAGAENAKSAVERTIQYIQEHYREVTHIEQLAQMANMSRRWYTFLFKEITGQSPTDYLTGLRITRAKELLHTSGNRLYDIAREIGFQDEHYFSRRFKQSVGYSPRQYVMNRRHVGISVTYPELLYSIGVTPIAAPVGYGDFPSYLKEPFTNVMRLSSNHEPDYESIAIAKPDFILAPAWKDQQHYEALSRIATTVLLPERNDWRDELRDMAEMLGKGKEARRVIENYEFSIEAAREQLHAMLEGESVAYIRMTGDEAVLYGAQSSRGKIIHRELGLKTAHALQQVESGSVLSLSSLSALNAADHIILHIDHQIRGTQETYKRWTTSDEWKHLSSFKRKQIYLVRGMEWYNFSFSPLATCRAAQELVQRFGKKKH